MASTEFCQESLLDLIFHRVAETGGHIGIRAEKGQSVSTSCMCPTLACTHSAKAGKILLQVDMCHKSGL